MVEKPVRISTFGDSECTISSVEAENSVLAQFFANRVGEILEHMQSWTKMGCKVDDIFHVPGTENPSDISTRGEAQVEDVQFGSVWQDGPVWLGEDRTRWPVSRDFVRKIPEEETRVKVFTVQSEVTKQPELNRLSRILEYSNNLTKVKGILARLIKMSMSGKEVREKYTPELRADEAKMESLSAMDYERATNLIYFLAMAETARAIKEGRLKALFHH